MTEQHPITPPQELTQQWLGNYFGNVFNGELSDLEKYLVTQASQWGYEQRGADIEYELQKARDEELEACCAEMREHWGDIHNAYGWELSQSLRAARRPRPKSLKEQALEALNEADQGLNESEWRPRSNTIRRALEQLDD